jgi:hypothetical protein
VDPALERRLEELERGYREALARDPEIAWMMARAYYLTDPAAAPAWIDRIGASSSCKDAVARALYYHAAGAIEPARRALGACAPTQAWERACVARLEAKIGR